MSFRLKTILGIALIEAILLTILIWTGLDYMQRSAEHEFAKRAEATVKAFTVTTKDAVIATNLATLQSLVDDILNYPGVLYARVYAAGDNELATAGDRQLLDRRFDADRAVSSATDQVFDVASDIEAGGMVFGRVELGLSTESLELQLKQVRNFGVGLAILEMVLVALFSAALGNYLTRQLERLTQASKHLARGEYGYQVQVQGNDELAVTARTFNAMSLEVRDTYARLAERNENLRDILENIQDGIITLDSAGRITSFSPSAEAIFGISAQRMIGAPLTRLVEGEILVTAEIHHGFAPGYLGQLLTVVGRRSDGATFPLEIRVTESGQKNASSHIAVVRDISERQRNEEDLRLRDRIIHASAIGVVIADARQPDYPVVYVNPAFERITGYRAEEAIGRNCRMLQGPDTDPEGLRRIRAAIEAKSDVAVLLRNYTKRGEVFWNDLYIMPIRDNQGGVSHFVGLQNDVTARINAQNELATSEAFLRRVLNSTRDAIIVINSQGIVESFNRGAEEMFGHTARDVIGANISMLVPEPHKSHHDEYLRRHLKTGISRILGQAREFEAVRRDGSLFPMVLRVNEMAEGGEHHFLGVIHDITERKAVENEIRDALKQKEILLKEIHHRVKNNLLVVSSILEMQQENMPDPEMRRVLQDGQDRIQSMALIHEKLYRSKNLDQVDFSGYLEQLAERLSSTYQISGGRVRLHLDLAPLSLNIETATPCGLIVNELLANCYKHAFPDGREGDLWVKLETHDGRIVLTVRDNGVGLPPEIDVTRGETLGLQLISLLSQQLNARLEVAREGGTSFRLEFSELVYARRI